MRLPRFHAFALALLLVLALPVGAGAAPDPLAAAITRQLHVNQERYGIAGQAVLVARDGAVLFRGAEGQADIASGRPARSSDIFPVYSLAKLFTSTLVMQLVERGEVDLDGPASAHVPGLPAAWRAITVRQFLDHTSGVPEYFGDLSASPPPAFPATLPAALTALAGKPLQFAPGTASRYTQTNYLVLTALLEARYGKPYPQIARERIVRKLRLDHTWLGGAALSKGQAVTAYTSKGGRLEPSPVVPWPAYAYGHAELYSNADDLAAFLQALRAGTLVGRSTLERLWQPQTLPNGQLGVFATGWEYGDSGEYRHVGHDGGAQVRLRYAFRGTPAGDSYVFIYLTNGSVKNVWSRTLVNSMMATVAPQAFATEAVSAGLIDYALAPASAGDVAAQADKLRANSVLQARALENTVNGAGYAVREIIGVAESIRLFELNTLLFPSSANTWDSLAEAYQAQGDSGRAKQLYEKSRALGGAK